MFTPLPPNESPERRSEPEDLGIDLRRSARPQIWQQIFFFAVRYGLLSALILGSILGLFAGMLIPRSLHPFADHAFPSEFTFLHWPVVTIIVFTPFMILVCAVSMSVQVLAEAMKANARRGRRRQRRTADAAPATIEAESPPT